MVKQTPCRDEFIAAQQRRARVPLRFGLYKIREAMWELDRMGDTVEVIAHRIQCRKTFRPNERLGGCTSDDKDAYLLAIPMNIAENLGYDMFPGIEALGGDGWPRDLVKHAVEIARREVGYVLTECERVHAQLQANLAAEYALMEQGQSALLTLIRDAEKVGEAPLQFNAVVNEAKSA